jgi:hypothetical protein
MLQEAKRAYLGATHRFEKAVGWLGWEAPHRDWEGREGYPASRV